MQPQIFVHLPTKIYPLTRRVTHIANGVSSNHHSTPSAWKSWATLFDFIDALFVTLDKSQRLMQIDHDLDRIYQTMTAYTEIARLLNGWLQTTQHWQFVWLVLLEGSHFYRQTYEHMWLNYAKSFWMSLYCMSLHKFTVMKWYCKALWI